MSGNNEPSGDVRIHLLMAHYGNFFWTERALEYWSQTDVRSATVSFQPALVSPKDMEARVAKWSTDFPRLAIDVIEISPSRKNHASFDHAEAVDALRAATAGRADFYVLADPDFWILSPETFNSLLRDLVHRDLDFLVADHRATDLAHPCLSVFRSKTLSTLNIFEGLEGFKHDFGRLWSKSLEAGKRNVIAMPVRLFTWGGLWYAQVGGIHFSSQSFIGSKWYKASALPWRRYSLNAPRRVANKIYRKFREYHGEAQRLPVR